MRRARGTLPSIRAGCTPRRDRRAYAGYEHGTCWLQLACPARAVIIGRWNCCCSAARARRRAISPITWRRSAPSPAASGARRSFRSRRCGCRGTSMAGGWQKPPGSSLQIVHTASDLETADLIIVGGGNTFQLLKECRDRRLLEVIRARVAKRMPLPRLERGRGARLPDDPHHQRHADRRPGRPRRARPGAVPDQSALRQRRRCPGTTARRATSAWRNSRAPIRELPVIGLPEGDWLRVSGESIELRRAASAAMVRGQGRRFSATAGRFSVLAGRWKRR